MIQGKYINNQDLSFIRVLSILCAIGYISTILLIVLRDNQDVLRNIVLFSVLGLNAYIVYRINKAYKEKIEFGSDDIILKDKDDQVVQRFEFNEIDALILDDNISSDLRLYNSLFAKMLTSIQVLHDNTCFTLHFDMSSSFNKNQLDHLIEDWKSGPFKTKIYTSYNFDKEKAIAYKSI